MHGLRIAARPTGCLLGPLGRVRPLVDRTDGRKAAARTHAAAGLCRARRPSSAPRPTPIGSRRLPPASIATRPRNRVTVAVGPLSASSPVKRTRRLVRHDAASTRRPHQRMPEPHPRPISTSKRPPSSSAADARRFPSARPPATHQQPDSPGRLGRREQHISGHAWPGEELQPRRNPARSAPGRTGPRPHGRPAARRPHPARQLPARQRVAVVSARIPGPGNSLPSPNLTTPDPSSTRPHGSAARTPPVRKPPPQ